MKSVYEGEKTGEVDWGYNFRQHFDIYCTSVAGQDVICTESIERFSAIVDAFKSGEHVQVTNYGGWPRCGYNDVIDIGMYKGNGYHRAVPCVQVRTWSGWVEWYTFDSITDYTIRNEK